jgi:hypothetical protein
MGKPANPTTVILKNEFYPQGLREIDVWHYYHSVKRDLIKENTGLQMMVYIATDLNKHVIRRYGESKKPIYLDPKSFDQIVTGRTLSFHASMNPQTRVGIIDVDVHKSDGFKWAQRVTIETYDYVMDKLPFITSAQIQYTGKQSFHIICDLGRSTRADTVRFMLEKFLRQSPLARAYTINEKTSRPGVPNLDLNRNAFRANHISLHALSIWGLKSVIVDYNQITNFDPRKAKI